MKELLTTTEAARLAGVGVSSIKRWADQSLIQVTQTPGGHRRVYREGLLRFIQESSNENLLAHRNRIGRSGAELTSRVGELSGEQWANLIMQSNLHSLQGALLDSRGRLGSWYATADEACAGLREIGIRWANGDITALEEHIASEKLERALSSLTDIIPRGSGSQTCLLACPTGEVHTLGLSFLEICLREANWTTIWVGSSTPVEELGRAAALASVQMVALSAAASFIDEQKLAEIVEQIGAACDSSGTQLIMGGRGAWPENPQWGYRFHSFTAFSSFVRSLR